jgi:hypothetical protein
MKITYVTAAQFLLLSAACLSAAPQAGVNPNNGSEGISAQISASTKEAPVRTLQRQLESYEQQLRAKAELVENARQEAISAGIQGDGAGPYIDACRQEQKELEALHAALTPKIEQTRAMIANLTMPAAPSDSAPSPKVKPARSAAMAVTASNSHEIH